MIGGRLGHYRVLEKLGEGGMGEVYLARDETLERNVALKILPPDLVGNEQRLRRFVLEAKSASSLNHPNIVTIYEIGSDRVRGADGEPLAAGGSDAPVHYIAMEYVQGETLGDQIHREKADLRTLVGYLAQVAEGLAKAHAAGIVHRDLKPGNVMVTPDGFAKVLDFGLAKLTERSSDSEDATATATVGREALTSQGMVVGTAGYMSPEQVAGKAVDARSDIFSFGCMVYEAAARQRPFIGDTAVDTLHKILNEKPKPIEELNPRVPADLRKVIRRCLAKSPDQRYQSVKDVAIELREIADQWETLPISGTSDSGAAGTRAGVAAPPARGRGRVLLGAAAAVLLSVILLVVFVALPRTRTTSATGEDLLQALKITSVVTGTEFDWPALSADGRYLAYVRSAGGRPGILIRQVSTGSDVQVVEPQRAPLRDLSFSPDGDYLYYLSQAEPGSPLTATLFVAPSLGGPARKVLRDVDSGVSVSPDGKRLVFYRGLPKTDESALVVFDRISGTEDVLTTLKAPDVFALRARPRWSPDGRKVVGLRYRATDTGAPDPQAVAFDTEGGKQEVLGQWKGIWPESVAWLPGDRIVLAGMDPTMNRRPELWLLHPADGARRRITMDGAYDNLSASADGQVLAATRASYSGALWSVSASGAREAIQVPTGAKNPGRPVLTDDGTLVFLVFRNEKAAIWAAKAGGGGPRQITPDTLWLWRFCKLPVSNALLFSGFGADQVPHLWRMDADGSNLVQLTRGGGEWLEDVSPDGRRCLFSRGSGGSRGLWLQSAEGTAAPSLVTTVLGSNAAFASDGTLIVQTRLEYSGQQPTSALAVIRPEGGDPIATLRVERHMRTTGWAEDASALAYVTDEGGVDTMMRWPVAGGPATPVFRFPQGQVESFRWSRDGHSVLFTARVGQVTNLWKWSAAREGPQQLTHFPSGDVGVDYSWSPDGSAVYFTQGLMTVDIVLIRGIK